MAPRKTTSVEVVTSPLVALANDPQALARFRQHAALGCTDAELAALHGISEAELGQFAVVLREERAGLQARIRLALLSQAERGQVEALAWLATRYLAGPAATDGEK